MMEKLTAIFNMYHELSTMQIVPRDSFNHHVVVADTEAKWSLVRGRFLETIQKFNIVGVDFKRDMVDRYKRIRYLLLANVEGDVIILDLKQLPASNIPYVTKKDISLCDIMPEGIKDAMRSHVVVTYDIKRLSSALKKSFRLDWVLEVDGFLTKRLGGLPAIDRELRRQGLGLIGLVGPDRRCFQDWVNPFPAINQICSRAIQLQPQKFIGVEEEDVIFMEVIEDLHLDTVEGRFGEPEKPDHNDEDHILYEEFDESYFDNGNNDGREPVKKSIIRKEARERTNVDAFARTKGDDVSPHIANCDRCGSNKHLKSTCKVKFLQCGYCMDKGHMTRVCPVLHGICLVCMVRGHTDDQLGCRAPNVTNARLRKLKIKFEQFADMGLRTKLRHQYLWMGFFYFACEEEYIQFDKYKYPSYLTMLEDLPKEVLKAIVGNVYDTANPASRKLLDENIVIKKERTNSHETSVQKNRMSMDTSQPPALVQLDGFQPMAKNPILSKCRRCGSNTHNKQGCSRKICKCAYCYSSGHVTSICPVLHGTCNVCRVRGHTAKYFECKANEMSNEKLANHRRRFEKFADLGLKTRSRWDKLWMGFYYFHPAHSLQIHASLGYTNYKEMVEAPPKTVLHTINEILQLKI